jgi:hypothetical protein
MRAAGREFPRASAEPARLVRGQALPSPTGWNGASSLGRRRPSGSSARGAGVPAPMLKSSWLRQRGPCRLRTRPKSGARSAGRAAVSRSRTPSLRPRDGPIVHRRGHAWRLVSAVRRRTARLRQPRRDPEGGRSRGSHARRASRRPHQRIRRRRPTIRRASNGATARRTQFSHVLPLARLVIRRAICGGPQGPVR